MHVKNGDATDADDENDEEFYQDKATLDGNRLHKHMAFSEFEIVY